MLAWLESLVLTTESPWSALQKLAWLNETPVYRLLSPLWGLAPMASLRTRQARDLADPRWLGEGRWRGQGEEPQIEGMGLLQRLALRTLAAHLGTGVDIEPLLRTCRTCMLVGYHSLFHQASFLAQCHIHQETLRYGCPGCGNEVDYGIFGAAKAYGCGDCQGFLEWDEEWRPQVPEKLASAETKSITALSGWRMQTVPLLGQPSRPNETLDPLPRLSASGFAWLAHRLCPSPVSPTVFGACPGALADPAFSLTVGKGSHFEFVARQQRLEHALELQDAVEEIERQFQAWYSDAHPCLSRVYCDYWVNMRGDVCPVRTGSRPCPVANALFVWRRKLDRLAEWMGDPDHDVFVKSRNAFSMATLRWIAWTELYRSIYQFRNQFQRVSADFPYGRCKHDSRELINRWIKIRQTGSFTVSNASPPADPDYGAFVRSIACSRE